MKELRDDDYVLADGAAWFTVRGFSVRIYSTDLCVAVNVYEEGKEMDAPIASTYAYAPELTEGESK